MFSVKVKNNNKPRWPTAFDIGDKVYFRKWFVHHKIVKCKLCKGSGKVNGIKCPDCLGQRQVKYLIKQKAESTGTIIALLIYKEKNKYEVAYTIKSKKGSFVEVEESDVSDVSCGSGKASIIGKFRLKKDTLIN